MAVLDGAEVRDRLIMVVAAASIVMLLSFFGGVSLGPLEIAISVAVIAGLSMVVRTSGNVSIGFVLVTIAALLWVTDVFIPSTITDAFSPIIAEVEGVIGVTLNNIPTLQFLILTIFFVTIYFIVRSRFVDERKGLDSIIDDVFVDWQQILSTYSMIVRAFFLLGFGIAIIFFETLAQTAGEVGNVIAQVPLVASNITVAALGYVGFGGYIPVLGDIPFLNNLTALGFAAIAIITIGLAAMAKYEGRGPLAQYLKR